MLKTSLDAFGSDFGHFWKFWSIFDFLKSFRRLDPPWNTGQKNFSKKVPQNMFKTLLDNLGTILGVFGILKHFWFFKNISKTPTSWNTGQKEIFPKNYPKTSSKHVWTLLGTILGIFGLLIVFWFFENISKTRPSLEHCAKKTSRKNFPTTNSKHVWTLLGKILGVFGILNFFWFFENISKTRPSMEHWAKKVYEKVTQKHVQNTFGHFWERFCAFLDFWKNFNFFTKTFRRLDPPWNTGQKNFSKKLPQNMFKTRLDILGTILGIFGTFENFSIFWKHFEDSTLHGTLGKKKFFQKITPKQVQNTFGHFWEQFWAFLDFW